MFLKKIFQFVKGYVIIVLTGNSVERFLNICTRRKIKIGSAKHMSDGSVTACFSVADFKKLRPIARKTHTRVRIKKKCGAAFVRMRYKKRVFFLAGAVIFLLSIVISTRFIWSIEVEGAPEEEHAEIIAAAELAGVRVGALKKSLPEGNEIKNIILTSTDNLTWAWVYLKGTKAVIGVREGIAPPKVIDNSSPCDIISNRDGIITKMTVKDGIAFAQKGDVVLTGDLLVGGTVGGEGEYKKKHALGDIYAATMHRGKARIKLFRRVGEKTGRKKSYTDLTIFSKTIPLYGKVKIPYEEYSVRSEKRELRWGRDGYFGISAVTNVYEEETVTKCPIGEEKAAKSAEYELEKELAKELLPGSQLVGRTLETAHIDDETLEVTLTMQFIEKIGEEVPIN